MWIDKRIKVGKGSRPLTFYLVAGHDRYWKDEGLREVYGRPENIDRYNSTFSRYFQLVIFLAFFGFIVAIESPYHGTSLTALWGVPGKSEDDRVLFKHSFRVYRNQRFVHKEFSYGKPNPWRLFQGEW